MQESELIRSIQVHENRNAFAFLVRQHQAALRGYLFHLCHGQRETADELAQENFLKAYRAIKNFKGDSKFTTWLFSIARHLYFDNLKSRAGELCESTVSLDNSDLKLDLQKALGQIPAAEREVLLLSYVQGLSHEEIAEITGSALGTVKTRIQQAKTKLSRIMMEEPDGFRAAGSIN